VGSCRQVTSADTSRCPGKGRLAGRCARTCRRWCWASRPVRDRMETAVERCGIQWAGRGASRVAAGRDAGGTRGAHGGVVQGRSPRRSDGCFPWNMCTCAVMSATVRPLPSLPSAGPTRSCPLAPVGSWGGRTSPRSCSRRVVRPGSTTMVMPRGRSPSEPASAAVQ
jgi:hypothetical protein